MKLLAAINWLPKAETFKYKNMSDLNTNNKDKWVLRLYVAGESTKSVTAYKNLKKICEEYIDEEYTIEIIDLLKHPQLGEGEQILALPTLIRKLPVPIRKIVGTLSDTEKVLVGLDIKHTAEN